MIHTIRSYTILLSLLLYFQLSYSQSGFPKVDSLLDSVKERMGYLTVYRPISFYQLHGEGRDSTKREAAEAKEILISGMESAIIDVRHGINCFEALALCEHFLSPGFAYMDSLNPNYHRAMAWIDSAIYLQSELEISERLAELHLTAANIAAPHFFFAYIPQTATEAEDRAFTYIERAGKIYFELGNEVKALECWRALGTKSLETSLGLLELAEKVEGDNSVLLAIDAGNLYHMFYYRDIETEKREKLNKYADLALEIYTDNRLTEYQQELRIRLLRDVGHYHNHKTGKLDKSLNHYQMAQDIEIATERKLYYTAFFLGAIYIQMEEFEKATAQYELAMRNVRLSATDTERAWFAIALIKFYTGDKKGSKELWRTKIGDEEIMNGLSGFYSYFSPLAKPKVKEVALELVDLVKAENAKRIIKDGWK